MEIGDIDGDVNCIFQITFLYLKNYVTDQKIVEWRKNWTGCLNCHGHLLLIYHPQLLILKSVYFLLINTIQSPKHIFLVLIELIDFLTILLRGTIWTSDHLQVEIYVQYFSSIYSCFHLLIRDLNFYYI